MGWDTVSCIAIEYLEHAGLSYASAPASDRDGKHSCACAQIVDMSAWCYGAQRGTVALMALHGLGSALAGESRMSLPLDAGAAMTQFDGSSSEHPHSHVREPAGGSLSQDACRGNLSQGLVLDSLADGSLSQAVSCGSR